MNTDYDVIIIGAGPAGASCAKHLVDNNIKVLLVEEKILPRKKCCSGLLNERALDFIKNSFGSIPENIFCKNKKMNFQFSKTGFTFVEHPDSIWLKTSRSELDYWLLQKSKAKFIDKLRYYSHECLDDHMVVNFKSGSKSFSYTAKYLVGCDGGNSKVRKTIDTNFRNKELIFAYQLFYEGESIIDKNYLFYLTGKKFSQRFAWFNYHNDQIAIGISYYNRSKSEREQYLDKVKELLARDFKVVLKKELTREGCFVDATVDKDKFCFGNKNNVLLAGESTGLLTYFGEGIPSALVSGYECAESILSNKSGNDLLDLYTDKMNNEKKYVISTWDF